MNFSKYKIGMAAFLVASFICAGYSYALDLSIEPVKTQRAIGGKVRVNIYANSAVNLISFGIKLNFNPAVLQADTATTSTNKYYIPATQEGWLMVDTGGSQYTTPNVEVDNTTGFVRMIGGRLAGTPPTGLSGKVLLGYVVFNCVGNGLANLQVDLGKYHPNHPTQKFDNFVRLDGTVDEPTNIKTDIAWIYVDDTACKSNLNGDTKVNITDLNLLKAEFGRNDCSEPGKSCSADINADGKVNITDLNLLKAEFGRNDCPTFGN